MKPELLVVPWDGIWRENKKVECNFILWEENEICLDRLSKL